MSMVDGKKAGIDFIGVCVNFIGRNPADNTFLMRQRGHKARDEQGTWEFGAGELGFGETLRAATLREMEEEYGVTGTLVEEFPAFSLIRQHEKRVTHWVAVPFVVDIAHPDRVSITEPEKTAAIGFFPLDNLPQPLSQAAQETLRRCETYFDKYR